jgi:hypothetical protein
MKFFDVAREQMVAPHSDSAHSICETVGLNWTLAAEVLSMYEPSHRPIGEFV